MSTLAEEKNDASVAASAEDHSGRPSYDDVNVPFVVVLGIISAIVTYVSIVGVQGLYYHFEDAQIREKEYGATIAAAKTIDEQKEKLSGFNEAKIRVAGEEPAKSIPIDLAMSLTLSKYANDSHAKDDHGPDDHAVDGHDSDHGKAEDHGKAADHGEKKTDAESADNPKAKEESKGKDLEQSDTEKKSDSKDLDKDSDKADDTGTEESKSPEDGKEDAPDKGDKE